MAVSKEQIASRVQEFAKDAKKFTKIKEGIWQV